jgi:hypothetical protein
MVTSGPAKMEAEKMPEEMKYFAAALALCSDHRRMPGGWRFLVVAPADSGMAATRPGTGSVCSGLRLAAAPILNDYGRSRRANADH